MEGESVIIYLAMNTVVINRLQIPALHIFDTVSDYVAMYEFVTVLRSLRDHTKMIECA